MRKLSLKQFSKEQVAEMSLIELAYELLVEKNEPFFFNDLANEIAKVKGASKAEIASKIAQFYTDLNIDGRFTSLGDNRWGLKTWYPVDQVEEEVVHTVKVKKKKKTKKAAVVDEDLDLEEDIEDIEEDFDDSDDLLDDDDDLDELDDDLDDDDDLEEDIDEDLVVDLDKDLDKDLIEDEEFELDDEELDEEEEKEEKEEK